ncbi:hypothetical protein BKA56DRAFT_503162 [Ilyonectria sp. MPI-CAGE-AT-0026]|nr:hypothetical protein BKA56DRAFT_503162 [Ilyonectria sp. MPI-CAGE-AT-0026]
MVADDPSKCDEAYPTCFNCKRQDVPCSLSGTIADSPETNRLPSHSLQPNILPPTPSSTDENVFTPPSDHASAAMATVAEQIAPFPPHELWSNDFELMHHYCTVTAEALSTQREMRHVWRVVMPKEGYRHPFVMHGILAISATHKAYLLPNGRKKYLAMSDYHQTVGSEGFRSALQNVCPETKVPIFCFASIVIFFMFALPIRSEGGRLEAPIQNWLELGTLTRGIKKNLSPLLPGVLRSEFAPIVYGVWPIEGVGPVDNIPSLENSLLPLDTWDAIGRLRDFYKTDLPSTSLEHYLELVDKLEENAKLIARAGPYVECGAVIAWIYGIHDSIIMDIAAYRPHALLILAYYSLFLSTLERNHWYTKGWSKQLIEDIEVHLIGQPKFLELFQWPKEKLAESHHWL